MPLVPTGYFLIFYFSEKFFHSDFIILYSIYKNERRAKKPPMFGAKISGLGVTLVKKKMSSEFKFF